MNTSSKKTEIAQALGVDEVTIWHKTRGKRKFTVDQAIYIQKTWFPDVPIDVLFQHDSEFQLTHPRRVRQKGSFKNE